MENIDYYFTEMMRLKDGWSTPESKAIKREHLLEYFHFLKRTVDGVSFSTDEYGFMVFPTFDQKVQAEWCGLSWNITLELDAYGNKVVCSSGEVNVEFPFYSEGSVAKACETINKLYEGIKQPARAI